MAIKFVRKPSDTPNINNIDDFTGLRYAYSNIDGFVKSKGSEIDYEINGSTFTVKSGRLVLQGIETDIDSNGVNITIDTVSTTRYYSVYLKVNLATNNAEILSTYDTAGYPNIAKGDDLTANTTGYAQLELYQFTATSGIISNVTKLIKGIDYASEQVETLKNGITNGTVVADKATNSTYTDYADKALQATVALYASDDTSKGTIETRLTNLGFRESSVVVASGNATTNFVKRQGNYVFGVVAVSGATLHSPYAAFTIPQNFRPKETLTFFTGVVSEGKGIAFNDKVNVTINIDGTVNFSGTISGYLITDYNLNFGYEANPIT